MNAKEQRTLNEKRSQAHDEHAKVVDDLGEISGNRTLDNHRVVTKRIASGRSRVITRLRSRMGFNRLKRAKLLGKKATK